MSQVVDRASSRTRVVPSVQAFSNPYDYWHDRYQAYYVEGMADHLAGLGGRVDRSVDPGRARVLRSLRRVRNASRFREEPEGSWVGVGRWIDRVAGRVNGSRSPRATPSGLDHPLVGQYLLDGDGEGEGRSIRFCIDASDGGEVAGPELLEWSDRYFKTNYWIDRPYPDKVVPLANGNPLLLGRLDELKALRSTPKNVDLTFIVRVWGGRDEAEGIEHNLRLIEAANRVDCRKRLLAYLVAGDVDRSIRRLESQGIPWTTRPIRLRELWRASAASTLVMIRLGMHQCLPWRLMDSLAMGSCSVLDQTPRTTWQAPLIENEHYLDLGVATASDRPIASESAYQAVPEKLRAFLGDPDRIDRVRRSAAEAFDRHHAPASIGRYVLESVGALEGIGGRP